MRLIVNNPTKFGNVWLREILSKAYQLPKITVSDQSTEPFPTIVKGAQKIGWA